MSDTTDPNADAGEQPDPNADPSIGDRVDQKIEEVKTELNGRIDQLQATVADLSARIDAIQGQPATAAQPAAPPPSSV